MTTTTLIEPWQNPKGRTLVQDGNKLRILSECCRYTITPEAKVKGSSAKHLQCLNCLEILGENPDWATEVTHVDQWASYLPSAVGMWAEFMFGLEDVKFKVTL